MEKHLHIITLNVPYPPDYGGMIDTYYRINWLHSLGIKIHLHCFRYGRNQSEELESICESVNYYDRKPKFQSYLTHIPGIIASRRDEGLLKNLSKDKYPVLFDGLHTTYYLRHLLLAGRKKFVRAHNIEHNYYMDLTRAEQNPFKKFVFYLESVKLKKYERVLASAEKIFAISEADNDYFRSKYDNSYLIFPFHPFRDPVSLTGQGEYVIFHGDLSIKENEKSAISLIEKVFTSVDIPLVIAGKNPSQKLMSYSSASKRIRIIPNPGNVEMLELIKNAHISLIDSYSSNGFKIKLLYALFAGRHCLVNTKLATFAYAGELCHKADSYEEFTHKINELIKCSFTSEMLQKRKKILDQYFSNENNAKKLVDLLFQLLSEIPNDNT